MRRKEDAVAVLRVPAKYGRGDDGSQRGGFSYEDVVFTPNEVLTAGKSGNAWVNEMEVIRKRERSAKAGESYAVQMLVWGWRLQEYSEGHATANRRMESDSKSTSYLIDGSYVPTESSAADFQAYARKTCIDRSPRISSFKGQLTAPSPCDASWWYYLPKNDDKSFVVCAPAVIYDEKLRSPRFCHIEGFFKLRDVGDRPFIVVYGYSTSWEDMTSGHWKAVNQRLETWIRSMEVKSVAVAQ